jgi:hypothetical protein
MAARPAVAHLGQSVRRRRGVEPRPRQRHEGAALKSKCIDKNGNGQIETSTGANDIKPWGQDECVLWHTAFPLANGYSGGVRPTRGRAWPRIR